MYANITCLTSFTRSLLTNFSLVHSLCHIHSHAYTHIHIHVHVHAHTHTHTIFPLIHSPRHTLTHTGLNTFIQDGNGPRVELQVNNSRSINLVPTLSYRIFCEQSEGGFGSATQVWFRDNVAVSTTALGAGVSEVYAVQESASTWVLEVQMFSGIMSGTYSCRMDDNRVALVIGSGV